MKGTELRNAYAALDKIEGLAYFRSETVHRGVAAVLAVLGARRLQRATAQDTAGVIERRYLNLLVEMEAAAVRLDAIPTATAMADARAEEWDIVLASVTEVRKMLKREQEFAKVRERRQSA